MTAIPYEDHSNDASNSIRAWRCESCHCIHLRTGQVLLTFTPEEFASFTQEVVACYCGQMVTRVKDSSGHARSQVFQLINEAVN